MQSAWIDRDADAAMARYANLGRDVALRVYTTRLLGQDPRLVLHGGGNTSVKTQLADLNGETVDVLCVKGSGWDMGSIEPAGLPAVRLAPLLKLRAREKLSDEDMVQLQRANLIDPMAPNPSVEALLHAFIPHKFVDHTHSTAVLALTDQPDGEALCREVYGTRVGYVPYIMPGFGLAKAAAQVFDADPSVEGLILVKHGIFSFGADAREAYERMIALVTLGRGAAGETTQAGLRQRKTAGAAGAARRRRADRPRRLQPAGRQERRRLEALRAGLPRRRCGDEFRQRHGGRALWPGRRGDAGSQHPHQEQAAGRCRARGWRPRRLQERGPRCRRGLWRNLQGLFCPQQRPRRRDQDHARSLAARGAGARRRPVRARPQQEGRARRRRPRRGRDCHHHRCGGGRPLRAAAGGRSVRRRILVAGAGEARAAPGSCRWRGRSSPSPAPPAPSDLQRQRRSRRPAPK